MLSLPMNDDGNLNHASMHGDHACVYNEDFDLSAKVVLWSFHVARYGHPYVMGWLCVHWDCETE